MIIDEFKLIRAGSDGGDSCHRTYSFYLIARTLAWPLKIYPEKYNNLLTDVAQPPLGQKLLEVSPGIYIRNPEPNVWYDDPSNVSRDQLTPVICFLATMANSPTPAIAKAYRQILTRLLWTCIKRGMFAQNIHANWLDPKTAPWKIPDPLLPDLWAVMARGYIRSWAAPLAIPVIILGDVFQVLGAMFKVWAPETSDGTFNFHMPGPDSVDDMNINNTLLTNQYNWPTPLSWLARKIYKKFRRSNYGVTQLGETSNVMGAIAYYNRDNPEFTELYRPLVARY